MHRFIPAAGFLLALLLARAGFSGQDEPRHVLLLGPPGSWFLRGIETVLNHFGYIAVRGEAEAELPEAAWSESIAAVVLAGGGGGRQLLGDLARFAATGKKLILLGRLPSQSASEGLPATTRDMTAFFAALGCEPSAPVRAVWTERRQEVHTPGMVGFERGVQDRIAVLPGLRSKDARNRVHFSIASGNTRTDLVVTGPFGGWALDPALVSDERDAKLHWVLDPFRFFPAALGLEPSRPIPDVTTLCGRRVLYCHIDGDAFTGFCEFDPGRTCGQVLYDEVLKKFSLPHTLSVVTCFFDPEVRSIRQVSYEGEGNYRGDILTISAKEQRAWQTVAQRVFSEPWVEPALHGYGHPLIWKDRLLALYPEGRGFSLDDEFDRCQKIMLEQILPAGQTPRVYLWTGDCLPLESHLERAQRLGLLNLNGGDTRLDGDFDSVFCVAPLARAVQGRLHVNNSSCNENNYTHGWKPPYYGFRNVIETFERTGAPRRLAPVNIYYHWYSGQYRASLRAVDDVYTWTRGQELNPVWASRYAQSVLGFHELKLHRSGNACEVSDYGSLRTLRFEGEPRRPRVGGETRVIGYARAGERLYAHLGTGKSARIEWLGDAEAEAPRLEWATCTVEDLRAGPTGVDLDLWGLGPAEIRLSALPSPLAPTPGTLIREPEKGSALLSLTLAGATQLRLAWRKE